MKRGEAPGDRRLGQVGDRVGGPPSMSLVAPPRTRYRPPCLAMVSLTAATYGSSPGRFVISASQTT